MEFENLPYILTNNSCINQYYPNVNIEVSTRTRTVNEEKVERYIYTINGLDAFVWNDIISMKSLNKNLEDANKKLLDTIATRTL